jgi:hypothetical protein
MSSAIWALAYDIRTDDEAVYLDWFHSVHIAEKLARDGYQWAAHYRGQPHHADGDENTGYVALFGGVSSAVFLNPSPAQLKLQQDATTRHMMGLRRPCRMAILAEEWAAPTGTAPQPDHPMLSITLLAAGDAGETLGAWAVQQVLPAVAGLGHMRKLISVTGAPHHYLIHHSADDHVSPVADETNRLLAANPAITRVDHWRGTRIA